MRIPKHKLRGGVRAVKNNNKTNDERTDVLISARPTPNIRMKPEQDEPTQSGPAQTFRIRALDVKLKHQSRLKALLQQYYSDSVTKYIACVYRQCCHSMLFRSVLIIIDDNSRGQDTQLPVMLLNLAQ